MTKIQLTIKTSYLPNWRVWEGVRELVQNGRDAELEHQAPLKIDWYNNTLRIENTGTTLSTKALLLGHTTKLGNSGLIGKFGEGLKLGVLALLRDNYKVKIRSGSDVWEPCLELSDVFEDEQVLTFHIHKGREFKNRVRVEIQGISKELWGEYKSNFLFLNPSTSENQVNTSYGTLLLDPNLKGKVYVKGIYVQSIPEYNFGYDLGDVNLDRDRKMVESWNLQYTVRNIVLNSVVSRPNLFNNFYNLLENNDAELKNLDSSSLYALDESTKERTADKFFAKYGKDAVAVDNLEQSMQVEHLGKRGIVVSKSLGSVLSSKLGSVTNQLSSLAKETVKVYSWFELTDSEKSVMTEVISEVSQVTTLRMADISIVDFRSKEMLGQFTEETISISRKVLNSYENTLATVLHEVAHRDGRDGEFSHISKLESLWTKIYANLRSKVKGV